MMKNANPGQKAHGIVFEYFTQQIFEGKLKIGSRLPPEREISERLGVSRNSTREAIRMLEMMGFVESIQGSGNYIRCEPQSYMVKALHMMMVLRDTDDSDLFHVQRAIEQEALLLALDRVEPESLDALHALLLEMDHCDSVEDFIRLDREFHMVLVRISRNELMIFLSQLTSGLADQLFENSTTPDRADQSQMEALHRFHWELYYGLRNRDSERIRLASVRHFEHFKKEPKNP